MKSSRLRRPKKASPERSRRPPTGAHADRNRHIAVRAAPARAERDDAAGPRGKSLCATLITRPGWMTRCFAVERARPSRARTVSG